MGTLTIKSGMQYSVKPPLRVPWTGASSGLEQMIDRYAAVALCEERSRAGRAPTGRVGASELEVSCLRLEVSCLRLEVSFLRMDRTVWSSRPSCSRHGSHTV